MANNLITLLGGGTNDALVLSDLRKMTREGVDVRLIADILAKAHSVMRRLGLDPSDTTPDEVYNALMNAVQTEQWLALLDQMDYVLLEIDGEVISFNPIDVVDNYHYELPIEKRRTTAAKKGLGWEITRRYGEQPQVAGERVKTAATRAGWPTEEPLYCKVVFGKPSVLTIGDIASEALISLARDDMEIVGRGVGQKIAISMGDKILAETAEVQDAVGGAANAAVAMHKLGIQPSLVSWLGDDTAGRRTLNYLRNFGIDMSGVAIKSGSRTNYHYVLRHGAERTILAKYEEFDYVWREPVCRPDWVYLSSISADSWLLHEGLVGYLKDNPSVKLAFQPGPAHLDWGAEKLQEIYAMSEVVVMNADEAMKVTGLTVRNIEALLKRLYDLGPKNVVITSGPKGAAAYDGEQILEIPSYPDPEKPVDRTGAGDAFASCLVAQLAKGATLEEALKLAPINSMSVVQQVGAQQGLLDIEGINKYLEEAPKDYKITKN